MPAQHISAFSNPDGQNPAGDFSCTLKSYANTVTKRAGLTLLPLSQMSSSPTQLPFPHPRWHVKRLAGETCKVFLPVMEERDPIGGYIRGMSEISRSMEIRWNGYVQYPESRERSSIEREAKRPKEEPGTRQKGVALIEEKTSPYEMFSVGAGAGPA